MSINNMSVKWDIPWLPFLRHRLTCYCKRIYGTNSITYSCYWCSCFVSNEVMVYASRNPQRLSIPSNNMFWLANFYIEKPSWVCLLHNTTISKQELSFFFFFIQMETIYRHLRIQLQNYVIPIELTN